MMAFGKPNGTVNTPLPTAEGWHSDGKLALTAGHGSAVPLHIVVLQAVVGKGEESGNLRVWNWELGNINR